MLIDGGHLIRRVAYTQQGQLTTARGEPSGIAHGFFSSLIYLSRQYKGNARAYVAFDSGISKYRSEIYPRYKCDREDLTSSDYTGPDIITAKRYIRAVLQIAGIPCFMTSGVEADDYIAALSFQFPDNSVIISSDQDFFQLVTNGVTLYDPIRKVIYDRETIVNKGGFDQDHWVDQYIFFKCIIGDKDEVPSLVKGVGPTRALPIAKMLCYGCDLDESKYSVMVKEKLDDLDRNIKLFDLRVSFDYLKDQLREEIQNFLPPKDTGLLLERKLLTALSKWELDSVSRNASLLLSLRSVYPIIPSF